MLWRDRRQSENVEDRRGIAGADWPSEAGSAE